VPKIESAKPLHCLELVTGKNLTGTLLLSEDRISTQIYSFADRFHIKGEQPVILQTETNDIVSLHSNVTTLPRTHWRGREPQRTTYRQEIVSNIAVVGHDAWAAQDRIKRVTFRVKHTKELMHHGMKVESLARKHPDEDNFNLFDDAAEGMTLRARYVATYGMDFNAPMEFWPRFEIEFDEPQRIEEYIRHVSMYVQFLSFCFGEKLKPSEIEIDRLSFADMMAAIKKQEYPGHHKVHYIWPEAEINEEDPGVGGSPVRAWDEPELASFRACLALWINRAPDWKNAYTLMVMSFGLKNTFSSERLISACRWFEDIPRAKAQPALSDAAIEAIATAAAQKADELGHTTVLRDRIAGSIKRLKTETSEQRFRRLLALVEGKFGSGILPGDAMGHLKRAISLRGKSAHGHFNPESDAALRSFVKSIRAIEALCYLLTAIDLPINAAGIARLRDHSVIRDYRASRD
jgi:ApeA N-terminal domain 1